LQSLSRLTLIINLAVRDELGGEIGVCLTGKNARVLAQSMNALARVLRAVINLVELIDF